MPIDLLKHDLSGALTMPVGRMVHVHDDRLFVAPVNFVLERRDVLLLTGEGAELLDAASENARAALEVDDLVNWSQSGWSVLIRGQLSIVTNVEKIQSVLSLLHPWAEGDRSHLVCLSGQEVTGRRIDPGPGGTTTQPV